MMTQDSVLDLYRSTGALREGHFRLSSGLHSDRYFQSALVLSYPEHAGALGAALGAKIAVPVDVVVGPAMGAVVIAHEVGRALKKRAFFAERVADKFTLRRGFALEPGERVLLVEDVLTTGGSILELAAVVEAAGARIAGLACLVDRRADRSPLSHGMPVSLAQVDVQSWSPEACPRCREGVAMDAPGSRKRA